MNLPKPLYLGKKQIHRITDADGNYIKDRVTLWDEEVSEGQSLLIPIIQNGELLYNFPNLHDIQAYTAAALEKLPESHKRITGATPYLVALDPVVA